MDAGEKYEIYLEIPRILGTVSSLVPDKRIAHLEKVSFFGNNIFDELCKVANVSPHILHPLTSRFKTFAILVVKGVSSANNYQVNIQFLTRPVLLFAFADRFVITLPSTMVSLFCHLSGSYVKFDSFYRIHSVETVLSLTEYAGLTYLDRL